MNTIRKMKLIVDAEKFEVMRNGREIILARKEFQIFCMLSEKPGKVYSRKEIFLCVWGTDSDSKERTVDVHIRSLRKKFGDKLIRTIRRVGYKLAEKNVMFRAVA